MKRNGGSGARRSARVKARTVVPARSRGLIRGHVRKGVRSDKSPATAVESRSLRDPTMCEVCGAVYTRKTWRAGERTARTSLIGVGWTVCPACRQSRESEYYGRVIIRGPVRPDVAAALERRIRNVAARARFTQPERRVVSVAPWQSGIEVLTTSQKLAHRIARELKKAFGGRTTYRWASREGELVATWECGAGSSRKAAPATRSNR